MFSIMLESLKITNLQLVERRLIELGLIFLAKCSIIFLDFPRRIVDRAAGCVALTLRKHICIKVLLDAMYLSLHGFLSNY